MSTREHDLRRIMRSINQMIGLVSGLTGAIMMMAMANYMVQMYIVAQEIARTIYVNAVSGTGARDIYVSIEITAIPVESESGTGATDMSDTVEEIGIGSEAESGTAVTSMSETIEVTSEPEYPP